MALNIAARVSNVVIPIVTRPEIEIGKRSTFLLQNACPNYIYSDLNINSPLHSVQFGRLT